MNSEKDDKLMPLIMQRCAATGAAAFKCLWKSKSMHKDGTHEVKDKLGERGLNYEKAVDCHLNAPVFSSVCLLCFSASGLCLLSGVSSLKKGQKCFTFPSLPRFQGPQLWLFLDFSFVLASAQKKKVLFQKKKKRANWVMMWHQDWRT